MIQIILLLTQIAWSSPQQTAPVHYEQACYTDGEDALTTHLHTDANRWVLTHVAFEEDQCQNSYLTFEIQYKVRQKQSEIDMTVTEVSYTTLTDEVTEALNWIGYCGFTDWKTHEKKVVSGLECDEYKAPAEGDITYSIVRREDNALYLGRSSAQADGKSPEQRHDRWDHRPFLRK